MTDEKKKPEGDELNEEQLEDVAGGGVEPQPFTPQRPVEPVRDRLRTKTALPDSKLQEP